LTFFVSKLNVLAHPQTLECTIPVTAASQSSFMCTLLDCVCGVAGVVVRSRTNDSKVAGSISARIAVE